MAAATYDDILEGGTAILAGLQTKFEVFSKSYKLADIMAKIGETVGEASDVIELLNIPKNTFVMCAGIIPTVADGAVLTGDLGDATNPDGFVDGVDLNSTTPVMTLAADGFGVTTVLGKFYPAADTLDLTLATIGAQTSHLAEFTVWAIMCQIPTS